MSRVPGLVGRVPVTAALDASRAGCCCVCTAWAPATCVIDEVLLQERVVVTNVTSHSVESASRLNLRIYLEAERLAYVCDSVNFILTSSVQFSPSSDLRSSSRGRDRRRAGDDVGSVHLEGEGLGTLTSSSLLSARSGY